MCRDFAHLAVTLCRCMNIPARYCTGYLGDIGVPPEETPMDYSAWFEVYLSGIWYTFDARHNIPRIGRIGRAWTRCRGRAFVHQLRPNHAGTVYCLYGRIDRSLTKARKVRFGSKADMYGALVDVRFVPIADIGYKLVLLDYSITSSARAIGAEGTSRPIAFAEARLISNLSVVGC